MLNGRRRIFTDGTLGEDCEHGIVHIIGVPATLGNSAALWTHGCDGCCKAEVYATCGHLLTLAEGIGEAHWFYANGELDWRVSCKDCRGEMTAVYVYDIESIPLITDDVVP